MADLNRRAFSLSLASLSMLRAAAASATTPAHHTAAPLHGASTFSHVGKELRPFIDQPEATLAEQTGSGFLDHLWFGGSFKNYAKLRLRIYIDHEPVASIDAQLGMAAGVGFADPSAPWGTAWSGITGAPSGLYLNYRIPFAKHVRITAQLPEGVAADTVFWWIARGLLNVPLTFAGFTLPPHARLRLHTREDLLVQPLEEFDLCRVPGEGLVFQVAMAAASTNFQFMEAQMRAYIGGQAAPQMLSSGLEDYFLGTYYFNRNLYHLPQAGLTHKDSKANSFSAYRFHEIDPLVFAGGLRLTSRCGEVLANGKTAGPTGEPAPTTFTTYTWLYEL